MMTFSVLYNQKVCRRSVPQKWKQRYNNNRLSMLQRKDDKRTLTRP